LPGSELQLAKGSFGVNLTFFKFFKHY
jgi:hypothetical protein